MSGEGALAVFAHARKLESQGRSIIHLELGEPDFHPGTDVIAAAKEALDAGKDRYCASAGLLPLRNALAVYLRETRNITVRPEDMVLAPGCKLVLFMALMALIEPGDEVLYPDPGFPGYPSITRGLGGIPVPFKLEEHNRFQPNIEEVRAKITPHTKILITNSPGNPTGTVYTDEVQRQLAMLAVEHDLIVMSDEIYARIVYGGTYKSMLSYPGMEERTIIIDGFSKSFGMTGWRLGYAIAPPEIASALELIAVNSYTCVAEFTQHAAIVALEDRQRTTEKMVTEFARRRQQFIADLNRIPGFRCVPPEGAFYAWVNISDTGLSAEELCRRMLEESGVAAIPGAAFGDAGREYVRFSFASSTLLLQEAARRIEKLADTWAAANRKLATQPV
ncbi:MAG TPA: pyridoxal phosphate-dependent aminotransferase [Terriglobales bacterium]|nr:pyridoxal phosphate-dependent aminotransferase [Terriglobales bacterium]